MSDNIRTTLVVVFLIMIGFFVISKKQYDSTDDAVNGVRSGMALRIDNLTGCHYLGGVLSGVTPRLDVDGKHVGCRSSE